MTVTKDTTIVVEHNQTVAPYVILYAGDKLQTSQAGRIGGYPVHPDLLPALIKVLTYWVTIVEKNKQQPKRISCNLYSQTTVIEE